LGETFKREYGPHGFIELTPTSGDALTAAKNGRYGLRIHSGAKNQFGALRPTHGCLRLSDEDFLALRQAIEALGEVTITLGADQAADVLPLAS
jgi:lipoprotein-anchoring transpeptidase ErfK/SrfK